MKKFIKDKRKELIWSISEQDYSLPEMADIFGSNTSTLHRIIKEMPKGWKSPWIKVNKK